MEEYQYDWPAFLVFDEKRLKFLQRQQEGYRELAAGARDINLESNSRFSMRSQAEIIHRKIQLLLERNNESRKST